MLHNTQCFWDKLFLHSVPRQAGVCVSSQPLPDVCSEQLSAPQQSSEIWELSGLFQASPPSSGEDGSVDRHVSQQFLRIHRNYEYYLKQWRDWQLFFPPLCQGIVKRDEIVFRAARRRGIPILMVTSGGYQKKTARIIADSILNLHQQGLIGAEALEGEGSSSQVTSMLSHPRPAGSTSNAV